MSRGDAFTGDVDLDLARKQVQEGLASVALACGGTLLGRARGEGLLPLVELMESLGWHPGAGDPVWPAPPALADRVVGKAAALVAARAGVRAVWGLVVSEPAREILSGMGIRVAGEQFVPFVSGRRPGQVCPMEALVGLVQDPADGAAILWTALGRYPRPLWLREIAARLGAAVGQRVMGRLLLGYEECHSTNDILAGLARRGYPEGTVVMAQRQTGGRGRLGRRWESPAGGIWMSVLLRPEPHLVEAGGVLVAAASLAACRALQEVLGLDAGIKWPNDIYLFGRKLGGILAEVGAGHMVLGIGLNAAFPLTALPPEVRAGATTLLEAAGVVPVADLVASLLDHVDRLYRMLREEGATPLLRMWRERATVLGKEVLITGKETWEGLAEDIDERGALLVRKPGGELVRVVAGDVSLRDPVGRGEDGHVR